MALDLRFLAIPQKMSTKELIIETLELKPRKICFSSTHKNSLKRRTDKETVGLFSVPFHDSIQPIFETVTGSKLYRSKNYDNYWCFIKSEHDYDRITQFCDEYSNIVFLKDSLELSIALGENFEDKERTYIGNLEYEAKYNNNQKALNEIIEYTKYWLEKLPFYKNVDFICAVPPSKKGNDNLPRQIVNGIEGFKFENISDKITWGKDKEALKEVKSSDKYSLLEETGLAIDCNIKNKVILLIDDLYQSGVTMQYIAKELKQAGATKVFGLSIVKSRRNTDNV